MQAASPGSCCLSTEACRERRPEAAACVLLTGASGGIGSVTASLLLERDAHVVAHYGANREGAEAACAGAEDRALLVQADLAQPAGHT